MTNPRKTFAIAAAVASALPVTALAAGVLETTVSQSAQAVAAAVVGIVLTAGLTWAAATSERFAGPARAKSPQDRTLLDKAIIEADKRIDAINRQHLQEFISNFVASRIDQVLGSQTLEPMRQADAMLVEALDAFKRRNPELAREITLDPTSFRELIASGIGRAQRDALAAALSQAGVQGVVPGSGALPESASLPASLAADAVGEGSA